jgi:hypothetical protein
MKIERNRHARRQPLTPLGVAIMVLAWVPILVLFWAITR